MWLLWMNRPTLSMPSGIEWLQDSACERLSGALGAVTHDRYFPRLGSPAGFVEVDRGEARSYAGNYAALPARQRPMRRPPKAATAASFKGATAAGAGMGCSRGPQAQEHEAKGPDPNGSTAMREAPNPPGQRGQLRLSTASRAIASGPITARTCRSPYGRGTAVCCGSSATTSARRRVGIHRPETASGTIQPFSILIAGRRQPKGGQPRETW